MRGSVVKKPNGRYYIVYYLGKKQKWEKVPEPNTKKNASRLLAQRVNEINRGEYREIKQTIFRDFAERWMEDYAGDPNHLKPSSAADYRSTFNAHLLPFFGDYPLTAIIPDLVQKFITRQNGSGLSPVTVRKHLVPLTTMFKHAVAWGYLRNSPMPYVERPKVRPKEMSFLTGDQIRRFLEHSPPSWRIFFMTGALTGMHLGELLAMRWEGVNFEEEQYRVREQFYRRQLAEPKSLSSVRMVDLSPEVLSALRVHRSAQNEQKLERGKDYDDQGLVFCTRTGGPLLNMDPMRNALKKTLTAVGCPPVRFHDFRHSYASLLIAQGASPKYIQQQLGHLSIQTTFDTYGHLMPEAGRDVVRRLDEQVFGAGRNALSVVSLENH